MIEIQSKNLFIELRSAVAYLEEAGIIKSYTASRPIETSTTLSPPLIIPLPSVPLDTSPLAVSHLKLGLRPIVFVGLMGVLAWLFVLNIMMGSVDIPRHEVIAVLRGGEASRPSLTVIIEKWRFPKAVTAMFAGAALAVSGLQMQTFFRNALADPFVLGISSGAGLGVALVVLATGTVAGYLNVSRNILLNISPSSHYTLVTAASLGAGFVLVVVMALTRKVENPTTLLIVGVMVGYLTNGIVSLLMYFSIPEQIQAYINWTFGSFSGVSRDQLNVFVPMILIGLGMSLILSKSLNALLLGEDYARSMGLNIMRTRVAIISSTAILAGTVTAFCGPIGFIGLAVPHLCRGLLMTSDHRVLMPATILMGGIAALVTTLIATMPGENATLPINVVTAFMGVPIILWIIVRRQRLRLI